MRHHKSDTINVENMKNWFEIKIEDDATLLLCVEDVCWVTAEWECFNEFAEFSDTTH
jgi:hypothetical protein